MSTPAGEKRSGLATNWGGVFERGGQANTFSKKSPAAAPFVTTYPSTVRLLVNTVSSPTTEAYNPHHSEAYPSKPLPEV
ncbi:MAG: hypothetical protein BWX84_02349 [Verrucomicrobia bacterium ADurb.Bin118]|nr:MAG: hypothetical protein BWX84_02349 [Verrucomicrobia bacterium ADurb.Bin118]